MNRKRKRHIRRRRGAVPPRPFRRGSVLIVVLVVIVLLTYGVYGFTERMLAEAAAAEAHGRAVQATAFAESGVELAASLVASRAADPENPISLYHEPSLCGGIILRPSASAASVGRFSLVAPVESDDTYRQIRFGLADESGKLNLNTIAKLELEPFDQQTFLMYLPGMTEEIADAILDYIDEDDEIRAQGAESETYEVLSPPYSAKNGPLESIDELLLVQGVTPELLYGEDANRNGLLDPAEDDGPTTPPIDNGDGVLNPGWAAFLTLHSRESNSRPDGSKKIFINQGLLTDLYDAVAEELDEDAARFIVAYRMYGPNDPVEEDTSSGTSGSGSSGSTGSGSNGGTGTGGGSSTSTGSGGGTSGSSRSTSGSSGSSSTSSSSSSSSNSSSSSSRSSGATTASQASQLDNFAGQLAKGLTGAQEGGSVTRGGLDLSKGAQVEITSLYDLIDREVDVPADMEKGTEAETITSPWSSGGIIEDFPILLDTFAMTENSFLEGRVNVNEARREVLLGLPEMTPQVADAIVSARGGPGGQAMSEDADRRTSAWVVARGIIDLPTMRKLDKYLTGRGDVFRVQSVGFFDGGGPAARIEAVIDGTVTPAKIVSFRDLSDLGRGYAPAQLLPAGAATAPTSTPSPSPTPSSTSL